MHRALSGSEVMAWLSGTGVMAWHAAGCTLASPPRASHNNGSPALSALLPTGLALGCERGLWVWGCHPCPRLSRWYLPIVIAHHTLQGFLFFHWGRPLTRYNDPQWAFIFWSLHWTSKRCIWRVEHFWLLATKNRASSALLSISHHLK